MFAIRTGSQHESKDRQTEIDRKIERYTERQKQRKTEISIDGKKQKKER